MPNQMTPPVLIEITRGPRVESCHRGQIAVVDAAGNLRHHLGDAEAWVCMRSLAKPFQALPFLPPAPPRPSGSGRRRWPCFPGRCPARIFRWIWRP